MISLKKRERFEVRTAPTEANSQPAYECTNISVHNLKACIRILGGVYRVFKTQSIIHDGSSEQRAKKIRALTELTAVMLSVRPGAV